MLTLESQRRIHGSAIPSQQFLFNKDLKKLNGGSSTKSTTQAKTVTFHPKCVDFLSFPACMHMRETDAKTLSFRDDVMRRL